MSKLKIKPLADRVVVEAAAADKRLPPELLFLTLLKKNLKKVL